MSPDQLVYHLRVLLLLGWPEVEADDQLLVMPAVPTSEAFFRGNRPSLILDSLTRIDLGPKRHSSNMTTSVEDIS